MFKNRKENIEENTYLLSYGFTKKVGDKLQYTEGGTGRILLNLNKKIKTQKDIVDVESLIKNEVNIENLVQISLYGFSLLDK